MSLSKVVMKPALLSREQKHDLQVTPNFNLSELEFRSVIPDEYLGNATNLLIELQKVRDALDKPIIITSGYRAAEYNLEIGGATKSQHITASAVDCYARDMDIKAFHKFVRDGIKAKKWNFGGLGFYDRGWIHADIRKSPHLVEWVG